MKTRKHIPFYSLLIILFLLQASCVKFLEEDYLAAPSSNEFYRTEEGMENLINSAYADLRIYYGQEFGYDFSSVANDLYDWGQEHPLKEIFLFSDIFDGSNPRLTVLWIEFYKALNACNDAIKILESEDNPFKDDRRVKRLAEAKFLRAHYLWMLVETWGDVRLTTNPTEEVTTIVHRSSITKFYDQIFKDLDFAVANFNDNDNTAAGDYGRINKDISIAFRARISLTWASIKQNGFSIGSKTYVTVNTDTAAIYYQKALYDANDIISSSRYELWDNYADLWELSNTHNNKSTIWPINYSRDEYSMINLDGNQFYGYFSMGQKSWDEREGGHHGHLIYGTWYNDLEGFQRTVEYGRGFRRYFPTRYLVDLFDDTIDQRWDGSFRTVWFSNEEASIPAWGDVTFQGNPWMPGDTLTDDPIFHYGDTGIVMYKGNLPDSLEADYGSFKIHKYRGYYVYDYEGMFDEDGYIINGPTTYNRNMFYELTKFQDPERAAANAEGSQRGIRDDFAIRLAEMYLIVVEAAHYLNQDGVAYNNLLVLANKRAIGGEGAAMLAAYGVNNGSDIDIDFILDERGREFAGEQNRWFDLKRTNKLVERIAAYAGNPEARENIKQYHMLRPVPQIELDALENGYDFGQNPGYN